MILSAASKLYGAAAIARRRWYAARPDRVRHLQRPVVSVGNLRAGGSGKTPAVAYIARLLAARGERPAILTRGYRRPSPARGVTVVSDPSRVLASFATAGDEPLMLARALPGVPVLVGADRHESGRIAEERFDTTVHVLDDGFQHLRLARDVNLLLVSEEDLVDRVLPAGWLREPLSAAAAADALVVSTDRAETVANVQRQFNAASAFQLRRALGGRVQPGNVLAVAGIARPDRFFSDLGASGWKLAGTMSFPDHHVYTPADVARISTAARNAGAGIVTTEKDAVRLETHVFEDVNLTAVPLTIAIEPQSGFVNWLFERIEQARATGHDARAAATARHGKSA